MVQPAKAYNDDVVNFYDEHLITRADLVYRFAFSASLNLDAASRLVRQTFEDVALNVDALFRSGTSKVETELLKICWSHFRNGNSKGGTASSKSQVVKVLESLKVEERVALVGVDVLGQPAAEMAKVMDTDEATLRRNLAHARKTLLSSSLDI